jgi:hypothetical protein
MLLYTEYNELLLVEYWNVLGIYAKESNGAFYRMGML